MLAFATSCVRPLKRKEMSYSSTFRTLDVVFHYHQYHIYYLFSCQGKIFIGVNCDSNLRRYPYNWRTNDVLLHSLLGVSVIKGKNGKPCKEQEKCKEDNTVLIQKRDEEQFSGLMLILFFKYAQWTKFLLEGISVECCKTKIKGKSKAINQDRDWI